MTDDEIAFAGASDLVRSLRSGELSSVDLVEALLSRIERLDPQLHAVIEINPEAVTEARNAELTRQPDSAPLHGIPVLVKDNIDTAAPMHTTAGSLALQGDRPVRDAPVVERLRGAGAIVLGKTNLSEWANYRSSQSASGWSAVGGLTANPHDVTRSAGGSSSGSGAAVAASFAPLAIGTETDGSISCPASLCGIVGVKPTVGLVPRTGIVPISQTQDTAGPMARTVRDAAELLTVLAGVDDMDPATRRDGRPESLDYADFCRPGSLAGVRIGVPSRTSLFGYHAGLDAAVRAALDVLDSLGASLIDDIALPGLDLDATAETTVLDHELKTGLAAYLATRPNATARSLTDVIAFNDENAAEELRWFGQDIFHRAAATNGLDAAVYHDALARCRRAAGHDGVTGALRRHDLQALAMPCYSPAWSADLVLGDRDADGCSTLPALGGLPLVSVPCGTVPGPVAPLPVALGLTAGPWSEPVLLRIAAGYEAAAAWSMKPRLS